MMHALVVGLVRIAGSLGGVAGLGGCAAIVLAPRHRRILVVASEGGQRRNEQREQDLSTFFHDRNASSNATQ